jgi:hypothetical protein
MTSFEYYDKIYKANISKKKVEIEPHFNMLMVATSFLPSTATYTERIYCFLNNITTPVYCKNPQCSNKVIFPSNARKIDRIYRTFCSTKCSNNSPEVQKLKTETCFINYGVGNPSCNNDIKLKKEITATKNYGGVGFGSTTTSLKIRKTLLAKYGNECISSTRYWKDRTRDKLLINCRYSREAISYIESFLIKNNIDREFCRYKDAELFLKGSKDDIFFYDLAVFNNPEAAKKSDLSQLVLILEYDGFFWHPTIDQAITFRNSIMPIVGKSYREKYHYDLRKEQIARNVLKTQNGKFIRIRSRSRF